MSWHRRPPSPAAAAATELLNRLGPPEIVVRRIIVRFVEGTPNGPQPTGRVLVRTTDGYEVTDEGEQ